MAETIYEIPVKTIDGAETDLGNYKGKVLLVVNVASKCGLTPQYEGLQKLYGEYSAKGFEILGFPANNFMGQEPGTEEEIKDFCSTNYSVTFPMFSKISVKGDDRHPLYGYLTTTKPETDVNDGALEERLKGFGSVRAAPNEVLWNFEKFLLGQDGRVLARFSPRTAPDDGAVIQAIEKALG